ncbi:hypothetical protein [Salinibacter ruber]|uniref:hypothetical protein n=1 Tax=Salinibacter ruber TaxID=146919 RepID=UPI000E58FD3A|nr:hypothetical protein [Salinibacter ruber]
MTNSEGKQTPEHESAHPATDLQPQPGKDRHPHHDPASPPTPTEEYRECLEEVAAILANGTDPTVTLAQLAMVLSEAEDRGLISPGPSGGEGSVLE